MLTPPQRANAASSAINAWVDTLGGEHVLTDAVSIAPFERATFATHQRVLAVLRPADAAQVAACLRIANKHRVPLYPISRGRNWGFGSAVPVTTDNVVLDLGRLDRITAYDGRLGVMTVEPGVTFQQAHAFLLNMKSDFYLPAIGGPGGASVIGNTVERGDTAGPQPDRWTDVCSLEVVLPTGDLLRTGFARYPGNALAQLGRGAPGPLVDGLFAQSNLGIVTSATLCLTPRPAAIQLMMCQIGTADRIANFLEALRPLVLNGALPPAFTIWNSYKLQARAGGYPWQATGGNTPLRLERMIWFASAQLPCASRGFAAAQRELLANALTPACESIQIFDSAEDRELQDKIDFLLAPNDDNVRSLYWRKTTTAPTDMDPNRDQCGAHWICLGLPFDGGPAADVLALAETMVLDAGFEPIIGFQTHNGRCLYGYVALVYDREVAGDDGRAQACHDALLAALGRRGIEPYRLGIQSMARLAGGDEAHTRLLRSLKTLLDPNGILAPGRYDCRETEP